MLAAESRADAPSIPELASGSSLPYRLKSSPVALVAAQAARTQAPFSAMVEIADRCNEACVHCYQVQGQKGELDTQTWKRIFDELAELGVVFLTISGGEPTLRKDFLELVAYARELRFAVKIYSNALNITRELALALGRLAVQEVQISLYSHRAEVHDSVTRVKGSFAKVEAATRYLQDAGVRVLLKRPLMQAHAAEYPEFIDFVRRLGAEYAIDPLLLPREDGNLAPTALNISKQTYLQVCQDERLGKAKQSTPKSLETRPCDACARNMHLEANGELRPCTQWGIPTGQALTSSLRDAWYGDPNAQTIRSLTWGALPACRTCDLRRYCKRCFAEAEQYTGNALAAYGRACTRARWKYEADWGVQPELESEAGSCDAIPLGPFLSLGDHRFMVQRLAPDARADHSRRDAPERAWLPSPTARAETPHIGASQLVQIRRRAAPTP